MQGNSVAYKQTCKYVIACHKIFFRLINVCRWDQRHTGLCLGQGTTRSSSQDHHTVRATVPSPFYNIEYQVIKKIKQNVTWIEADILGINLAPNQYNEFAPASVYVSNGVTIPFNSVTSALLRLQLHSRLLASMDWAKTTARRDEKHIRFGVLY